MSPLFIFSLITVTAAVSLGLFFHYLLVRRFAIVRHIVNACRHYEVWLEHLPVNPLTRILTSRKRVSALAQRAQAEATFSLPRVWRYKELSFWLWFMMLIRSSATTPVLQLTMFGVVSLPLALFWPELYLLQRATRRARSADRELAHAIDLLYLYVVAGQNLEAAVESLAKSASGFWGRVVFRQVVRQLQTGVYFEDALNRATERWQSPDFRRLILALKQSRILGASLSDTLATQAALSRSRRKQLAEEKARTAAVKIAVPLVLFIFPALLIIYLAPAVLKIVQGL